MSTVAPSLAAEAATSKTLAEQYSPSRHLLPKAPAQARRTILVPRSSARRAEGAFRRCPLHLPAPRKGPSRRLEPVDLFLVHVQEELAPPGVEPLEWHRLRWRIEDWHRVFKSGCQAEHLGHRTGERIERG